MGLSWFGGLGIGVFLGVWAHHWADKKTKKEMGDLLVDCAVQRALIKALLGVCDPYHDDQKVAAVIKYVQDSLERLEGGTSE